MTRKEGGNKLLDIGGADHEGLKTQELSITKYKSHWLQKAEGDKESQ